MPKFFNQEVADLTQQLTRSPRRLRMKQVHGIDQLLGIIDQDKAYPFEFVCYHITKFRKRDPSTGFSVPGKALISDLVTMAEILTRQANIPVVELGEKYQTHEEVAQTLGVSTKTIRRWRNRGLMGIRVVFADGVNRLAYLARTVDRFLKQNQELVSRGASFKQLTAVERRLIVERAAQLVSKGPTKLHSAARIISGETGRAVETIRYTLRRNDSANPETALFTNRACDRHRERDLTIWRCRQAGDSLAAIARSFECEPAEIQQSLWRVDMARWSEQRWAFIHHELYDAPNADELILEVPEPAGSAEALSKAPKKDVPAYLRSLYLTPLLSREQEHDLFRRYNYLKSKTAKAIQSVDLESISEETHAKVKELVAAAECMRQRIIQANLRLVVSIAKKHLGWSSDFFHVVSDGNMSLMRAVEKFDISRGTRFSTYATWAIVKNYARSIPEQRSGKPRQVTGQEELLHAAPDHRDEPASQSDQKRVREMIASGLETLDKREREVVKSHFGLGADGVHLTLEQIGERFGVTKERIRQIERRALTRLHEVLSPSIVDVLPD